MARQGRVRPGMWLAVAAGAALLLARLGSETSAAFTGAAVSSLALRAPAQPSAVGREAKGFGIKKTGRKRVKVDEAQVMADHGPTIGKEIIKVLKGERVAETPGEMARARYSALRNKDALFMARTERDDDRKLLESRARGWAVTFGQEERDEDIDGPPGLQVALESLERFEFIEEKGDEVEFKLHCGKVGLMHERSIFEKSDKWGWIFSGDNVFQKDIEGGSA